MMRPGYRRAARQARIAGLLAAPAVLLCLAACAGQRSLEPAPAANTAGTDGLAAKAATSGITITARAGAWPGRPDVEEVLTPLEISIDNDSEHELRIRYADFALVGEEGARFAVLPPYAMQGSVSTPALAGGYSAITSPGFKSRRFRVAAHYRPVYPTLTAWELRHFHADPYYYSHYYPFWGRLQIELPTPHMLRLVLPEGVLSPGGHLEGFLYFEKVDGLPRGRRVSFHADLVDADSGQMFATVHIPFVVEDAQ